MELPISEHVTSSGRHTTFYLECGPVDGPLIVFVHGWPELSLSWRHQLPCFASLGFRAIAPDMRGYGRSTVHVRHEDYAIEQIVGDMLELLQSIGRDKAVWVGHDWGSPVVWSMASHHAAKCHGVANLCVPYFPGGFTAASFLKLIDRSVYPAAEYPAGQWEYQLYYQENFESARKAFEADVRATMKAIFRRGSPEGKGKPARTARVRKDGGWFGGAGKAPDLPLDTGVLNEADLDKYVLALETNGFFGPDSWYMNHERNAAFAKQAEDEGRLRLPVLFLHGDYDYTCETMISPLARPMRAACTRLTEVVVRSGHWMAQEQPAAVNAAVAEWLASELPELWAR